MRVISGAEEDFGRYAFQPLPEEAEALPEAAPVAAPAPPDANPLTGLAPPESWPAFASMPPATSERPASDDAFAALPEPAFQAEFSTEFEPVSDLRRELDRGSDDDRASTALPDVSVLAANEPAVEAASDESAPPAPALPAVMSAGYLGETPVDASWLAQREAALMAVRADYAAARDPVRAAALASIPAGRGYFPGPWLVHVGSGRMVFDEDAFAASYRAEAEAPLQALAEVYDTDIAGLLALPDLWTIATSDHALNAGPPARAGVAMGDAAQLRTLDFYLADPQIAALIDAYGGTPAPAAGPIALEQVRFYGERRFEQLSRLAHAMQSVRDQFTGAMAAQAEAGSGAGWVERSRTVSVEAEGMMARTEEVRETVFDPDAFSAWYVQQGGLQHQAFADFYGAGHFQTLFVGGTEDSPGRPVLVGRFDNADWVFHTDEGMHHSELAGLDPNRPPDLYDDTVIGFDPVIGWVTPRGNLEPDNDDDWIFTTFQVAAVAVVAWACYPLAAQAGAAVAGATGATVAGAVTTGAIMGGVGATVSGLVQGNLTVKSVLRGALVGGVTAGVMNVAGLDSMGMVDGKIVDYAKYTMAVTGRATLQGALAELTGSRFKDGFISGFSAGVAQGLAAQICAGLDADIRAIDGLSSAERGTLQMLTRVLGSSIRALASPDDPLNAFASDVINSMLGAIGPAPGQTNSAPTAPQIAFDDDGHLMPGVVDTRASLEQQQLQLRQQLERQGIEPMQAEAMAARYFASIGAPTTPVAGPAPAPGNPPPEASPPATVEPVLPPVEAPPPPPAQVIVQPGDSLYRIAAGLAGAGASAGEINDIKNRLAAANPQLQDLNRLSLGQVLNLPTAGTAVDAFSLARLAAADAQYQAQRQAQRPVDPQAPVFPDGALSLDQAGPSFSDLVGVALPSELAGTGVAAQGNALAVSSASGLTLVLTSVGRTLGALEVSSMLAAVARFASSPAAAGWSLLFAMPNATVQYQDLGEGMRFKTQPGESFGLLQRQQPNGEWVTDAKVIRPEQISGMLTPEERARLLGPLPGQQPAPPAGGPLITPLPAEGESSPQVPGYEGEAPQGPSTTTTPIHQPSWRDLLIAQGNADPTFGVGGSSGANLSDVSLPGMPHRITLPDPNFPPDVGALDAMNGSLIQRMAANSQHIDCSEIAYKLQQASSSGGGHILRVTPKEQFRLNVFENGEVVPDQWYHEVFTDGRYVFDPRISLQPVQLADWYQHMKGINPNGVTITPK